jgi:hypothetical protein
MKPTLFDSSVLATEQQAVEFASNILESSTEYSIIGKDLDGKILLWNEGARRMWAWHRPGTLGGARHCAQSWRYDHRKYGGQKRELRHLLAAGR